jgi:hypothetical protein
MMAFDKKLSALVGSVADWDDPEALYGVNLHKFMYDRVQAASHQSGRTFMEELEYRLQRAFYLEEELAKLRPPNDGRVVPSN